MATTATTIKMYDLAGADPDRRFSPYCWRIRMALAHKHLAVETIPWRYCEKAAIAHSGHDKVPVIEDGGRAVGDSWAIANYLEDAYPERPSLFGGAAARAIARFVNNWADTVQNPGSRPSSQATSWAISIRATGISSRVPEQALRHVPQQFCANREARVADFRKPWSRCGRRSSRDRFSAAPLRSIRITSCSAAFSGRAP